MRVEVKRGLGEDLTHSSRMVELTYLAKAMA